MLFSITMSLIIILYIILTYMEHKDTLTEIIKHNKLSKHIKDVWEKDR